MIYSSFLSNKPTKNIWDFLEKTEKKTPTWRIIILHSHGISHFHGHLGFGLPPTAVILRGLQ